MHSIARREASSSFNQVFWRLCETYLDGEGSIGVDNNSLRNLPTFLSRHKSFQTDSEMASDGKTVNSVTINYQAFEDSKLYRLKKSTVLRVVPGESLLGKHISIQTNYPAQQNEFVRNKFVSLEWFTRYGERVSSNDNYAQIKDLEMYCQVTLQRSGTFRFYILEEDR